MRFGERLLNSVERKIGNWALPGLLKWIVCIQFMGMCFVMLSEGGVMEELGYNRAKIFSGEVWRLITWVFLPSAITIFYIIWVFFMFFISNVIEEHIGVFRTNALVIGSIICFGIAGLLPFSESSLQLFYLQMPWVFTLLFGLVAATMIPDHVIYLWMIIPVKMKWIGVLKLALILWLVVQSPNPFATAIVIAVSFLPFLVGILPPVIAGMKNTSQAAVRRSKFERDSKINDDSAFHTCHNCGLTDIKNPTMEFRVSSKNGHEYCSNCRERQLNS